MNTTDSHRSIVVKAASRRLSLIAIVAICVAGIMFATSSTALAQQSTSQFSAAGNINTPQGGLALAGTGINPATGNPFRHLWTSDPTNGLCRLDPDVDTAAAHSINPATCRTTINGAAFNPGQLTFDPASNTIYAVDGANKLGIFVLNYQPSGDSGHGLLDLTPAGAFSLASNCGIAGNQPDATSLGPDGNLYVGFRRSGNIMRIVSPLTNPLPCANVQPTVISTGDRLTSQMAWVGHTLFLNDSRLVLIVSNGVNGADGCFTPQNGNIVCTAFNAFSNLPIAQGTMASDQAAGQLNGDDVYFGGSAIGTVSAETGLTQNAFGGGLNGGTFTSPFGGGSIFFSNIGALAIDAFDPANHVLYVGDDPSAGVTPGAGRWFQILSAPPTPAPPSAPLNVVATAGNASATLSWTAPANHQPVTSYTVTNSFASDGLPVADVRVAGAPGSTIVPAVTTITGLVNGTTYQFEVLATNNLGSSPFSAPSNSVTPQAPTAPGAPTNVVASAGDTTATVSWTAPASNGGSPITGYTVTAYTGGAPTGFATTVGGGQTSVTVFALTNGVAYTFSVHATNAVGNGPESTQSAAVTPAAAPSPDVSLSASGPASVVAGANAVYTFSVNNAGPGTATGVTLNDVVSGATVSSVTTSQGTCTTISTSITCNLGSMAAGNNATVTVTLKPTTQTTNSVGVSSTTTDNNQANNSATVTTQVIPLNQTTDLQVTGAAQNGGPAVTASDSFTWQIKNAQTLAASGVHFTTTLPDGMVFQNIGSTLGAACAPPAAGTPGPLSFSCDLATLPGGQTLVITVGVTFSKAGNLSTTGSVSFSGTDNNPGNNSAAITVGVK